MTPAEHLALAEDRLQGAVDPTDPRYDSIDRAMTLNALVHAVIALAAELGVPHPAAPVQEAHSGA